jgi:very-short-patch-repair endonuclease
MTDPATPRLAPDLADLLAVTGGVAAGPTAALLHGFDLVRAPVVQHVVVPRRRHTSSPLGCRLHRLDLHPSEVVVRRGLAVTGALRTVRDCARWLPLAEAVAVADCALRRRAVTSAQLQAIVEAAPRSPVRSALARVLALVDDRSESVLESLARVALALAGIPTPVPQLRIGDRHGVEVARVDLAWPEARVVLELDGFAYHSSRRDAHRDRLRANRLVLLGWQVLRAGWEETLGGPVRLVATVRAALDVR